MFGRLVWKRLFHGVVEFINTSERGDFYGPTTFFQIWSGCWMIAKPIVGSLCILSTIR